MSLPTLPVPDLQQTLSRYLSWVRPLLDEASFSETQSITQQFAQGPGKQLQERLQQFAQQQNRLGESYLSQAWLSGYLSVRESLPLSTSGAFRLALDLPETGLKRLAYLIAGFAQQSADYLNDVQMVNTSPRGEPLDMRQWLSLRGIGRIPQPHEDRYELAPLSKQTRYMIVFWTGCAYAIPILDADHRPYDAESIARTLKQLVTQECNPTAIDICALSLAPSEQAAEQLKELSQNQNNADNFRLLAHSLLHIHLSPEPYANDEQALTALTFMQTAQFWAYKPLTICTNLANDNYFAHLEHGSYDAGALQSIFARAQATAKQCFEQPSKPATTLQITPLHWVITTQQQQQLTALRQTHAEKARPYQVRISQVSIEPALLPEKTSLDGLMQWMMQYAQLKVFGQIFNTYEAVDVSHFQAGRTECVRPVTEASVAFVQSLLSGKATLEGLNLANQAHKERIKACKSGNGVNRHLQGLALMAEGSDIDQSFFQDKGYQTLTKDFLSTSSLGDRQLVGDFAFKPVVEGGLGISYFSMNQYKGCLFCLSYHQQQQAVVEGFIDALSEGAKAIMTLLSTFQKKQNATGKIKPR